MALITTAQIKEAIAEFGTLALNPSSLTPYFSATEGNSFSYTLPNSPFTVDYHMYFGIDKVTSKLYLFIIPAELDYPGNPNLFNSITQVPYSTSTLPLVTDPTSLTYAQFVSNWNTQLSSWIPAQTGKRKMVTAFVQPSHGKLNVGSTYKTFIGLTSASTTANASLVSFDTTRPAELLDVSTPCPPFSSGKTALSNFSLFLP